MITIDELDDKHAQVAIVLLTADAAWPVYTDKVPDGAVPPYAKVDTIVSWPDGEPDGSLDGATRRCVTRWYVHSVGDTDINARSVAGRSRQLLLNVVPTITGRSCGRIKQDVASLPPVRDETSGVLRIDVTAVYKLTTEG